ncbi:predicted protein, partial [Nematostella vectensis]
MGGSNGSRSPEKIISTLKLSGFVSVSQANEVKPSIVEISAQKPSFEVGAKTALSLSFAPKPAIHTIHSYLHHTQLSTPYTSIHTIHNHIHHTQLSTPYTAIHTIHSYPHHTHPSTPYTAIHAIHRHTQLSTPYTAIHAIHSHPQLSTPYTAIHTIHSYPRHTQLFTPYTAIHAIHSYPHHTQLSTPYTAIHTIHSHPQLSTPYTAIHTIHSYPHHPKPSTPSTAIHSYPQLYTPYTAIHSYPHYTREEKTVREAFKKAGATGSKKGWFFSGESVLSLPFSQKRAGPNKNVKQLNGVSLPYECLEKDTRKSFEDLGNRMAQDKAKGKQATANATQTRLEPYLDNNATCANYAMDATGAAAVEPFLGAAGAAAGSQQKRKTSEKS